MKFLRSRLVSIDRSRRRRKLYKHVVASLSKAQYVGVIQRHVLSERWKNDKRNVFHPWEIYGTGKWRLGSKGKRRCSLIMTAVEVSLGWVLLDNAEGNFAIPWRERERESSSERIDHPIFINISKYFSPQLALRENSSRTRENHKATHRKLLKMLFVKIWQPYICKYIFLFRSSWRRNAREPIIPVSFICLRNFVLGKQLRFSYWFTWHCVL